MLTRIIGLCLPVAVLGWTQPSQPGLDQLMRRGKGTHINWSLSVGPPTLSEAQRLRSSIVAAVDESEMVKRRSPGQVLFLMDVRDRRRRLYQTQRPLPPPPAQASPGGVLRVTEEICVLPGDYEVAAAIYDTQSDEYSIRHAKLRVPSLSRDPFPNLWHGLPAIESGGRACLDRPLALKLRTRSTVRLDVVVNAPLDPDTGILERTRVVSEIQIPNGSLSVTALDLERHEAIAEKTPLDQTSLSEFPQIQRGEIDANVLAIDDATARFLVSQLRRSVGAVAPDSRHALIILTNPRALRKPEDARSIPVNLPPRTRIFIVLCDPPRTSWVCGVYYWMCPGLHASVTHIPTRTGDGDIIFAPPPSPRPNDSLERLMEPLHPERFEVSTALEFRRALAKIMAEISNL